MQSSDASLSMPEYGKWNFRVQACNSNGCSKPIVSRIDVLEPEPTPEPTPEPVACQPLSAENVQVYGIEFAAVVTWEMPETEDSCEVLRFVVTLIEEMDGYVLSNDAYLPDTSARSYAFEGLEVGPEYRASVTVFYSEGESSVGRTVMFSHLGAEVTASCNPILAVSSPSALTASGSWHNPDSIPGCEAGGVYVDHLRASTGGARHFHAYSGIARSNANTINGGIPGGSDRGGTCDGVTGRNPQVVSTPTNSNTYIEGDVIRVCLPFNEPVLVEGSPVIGVKFAGDNRRDLSYESGSGTKGLLFSRTVERDNNTGGQGFEVVSGPLITTENDGVYVRVDETNWESSYLVPNREEDLDSFIYGDLDGDSYYVFRVRVIDAKIFTEGLEHAGPMLVTKRLCKF